MGQMVGEQGFIQKAISLVVRNQSVDKDEKMLLKFTVRKMEHSF